PTRETIKAIGLVRKTKGREASHECDICDRVLPGPARKRRSKKSQQFHCIRQISGVRSRLCEVSRPGRVRKASRYRRVKTGQNEQAAFMGGWGNRSRHHGDRVECRRVGRTPCSARGWERQLQDG